MTDVSLCRADAPTSYEQSNAYLVGYAASHAGKPLSRTRVYASPDAGSTIKDQAYTQHADDGSNYATSTDEQVGTVNMLGGIGAAANLVTVRGNFARNAASIGYYANNAAIDYLLWPTVDISNNGALLLNGLGAPGTIKIRNGVFHLSAGAGHWFVQYAELNGATIQFENCIFWIAESGSAAMTASTWTSGILSVFRCIFILPNGGRSIAVPAGVTYTGNNNVFLGPLVWDYQGSQKITLAAWRIAGGQDANSIALDAADLATLFSGDTDAGDYRLNGGGAGAEAAVLSAGPQFHWDFNTRAVVAGPPTAYPDIPTTLAEHETYIGDPEAWDFYP